MRRAVPDEVPWVDGGAEVPRWAVPAAAVVLLVLLVLVAFAVASAPVAPRPAGPVVTPTTYGPPGGAR